MADKKEYWKEPTQREMPHEQGEGEPKRAYEDEPFEARPTPGVDQGGSSPTSLEGGNTVNPASLSGGPASGTGPLAGDDQALEELSIHGASDPSLGMTNIGDVPAQDWAADTGPTIEHGGVSGRATRELDERGSTLEPADADLAPDEREDPVE